MDTATEDGWRTEYARLGRKLKTWEHAFKDKKKRLPTLEDIREIPKVGACPLLFAAYTPFLHLAYCMIFTEQTYREHRKLRKLLANIPPELQKSPTIETAHSPLAKKSPLVQPPRVEFISPRHIPKSRTPQKSRTAQSPDFLGPSISNTASSPLTNRRLNFTQKSPPKEGEEIVFSTPKKPRDHVFLTPSKSATQIAREKWGNNPCPVSPSLSRGNRSDSAEDVIDPSPQKGAGGRRLFGDWKPASGPINVKDAMPPKFPTGRSWTESLVSQMEINDVEDNQAMMETRKPPRTGVFGEDLNKRPAQEPASLSSRRSTALVDEDDDPFDPTSNVSEMIRKMVGYQGRGIRRTSFRPEDKVPEKPIDVVVEPAREPVRLVRKLDMH